MAAERKGLGARIQALTTRLRRITWIDLLWRTAVAWSDDGVPRLAAALSYYTTFSLAPLLVIVLAIIGMIADKALIQHHLELQVAQLLGTRAATAISELLGHITLDGKNPLLAAVGVLILLFGATGVLVELKGSLNLIWRVPAQSTGSFLMGWIRRYFAPLTLLLGIGFLLLVSLMLSAGMALMAEWFSGHFPALVAIITIFDQGLAYLMVIGLFALIYKILPDVRLEWRDVWLGAACAGALFVVGRLLIGIYLGRASFTSGFGAAGSLVVVLAWIYYSAQILFFGAEFTRIHALKRGREITAKNPPAAKSNSEGENPMHPATTAPS
jgi:membrane protein